MIFEVPSTTNHSMILYYLAVVKCCGYIYIISVASTSVVLKTRPAKLFKESWLKSSQVLITNCLNPSGFSAKMIGLICKHLHQTPGPCPGDGDGKKKKNQQKYLEKKYIFFSCRQRWLTMWKLFFPCTAAERGTSEETFNLKSINTATENGIKSALSCSLNKKHRFPIQLYDRFLEAGIKASPCTHGDQNGALML